MAGRKKKATREPLFDDLSPHTKQAIGAVGFVVLAIYFTLSLMGTAGMVGGFTKTLLPGYSAVVLTWRQLPAFSMCTP
ncbi:MAG: hypothetical protein R3B69_03245 [Candidatus Paceibacterota bacterium]